MYGNRSKMYGSSEISFEINSDQVVWLNTCEEVHFVGQEISSTAAFPNNAGEDPLDRVKSAPIFVAKHFPPEEYTRP